jgi:phage terminase small subunit
MVRLSPEKSKINTDAFAAKYVSCGNAYEAAVFAGAPRESAAAYGLKLLCTARVRRKIRELKLQNEYCTAQQALRKIAFGRINDAVKLAFAEEVTPEMIERAELSCVSEIKRVKGGGVEIKFFDRMKAAEQLAESEKLESENSSAENLITAIYGKGEEA